MKAVLKTESSFFFFFIQMIFFSFLYFYPFAMAVAYKSCLAYRENFSLHGAFT